MSSDSMHRVTVIGTGSIGERHTRCFLETGRAKVGICEIDEGVRSRMRSAYSLAAEYADFSEMLRSETGIAVICTPAQLHISMAQQLVESGFHVLIEKPLSTNLEGVERLLTSIENRKRHAAVAYVLRSSPLVEHARQIVSSGELGELVEVVAVGGQHFPTYRPAYREIYYRDRETGGGAIQDALTHWVNAVQWFAGPMDRVAADCHRLVLEGVNTEDSVNAIARHGGTMVSYSLNQHQAPNETVFRFVCRRGVVEVLMHEQLCRARKDPAEPWQTRLTVQLERDDVFVAQASRFLDVVEGNASPACTVQEGLSTLRANLAILQAADSRQWVSVMQ